MTAVDRLVPQSLKVWHRRWEPVTATASETLKARVDKAFARKVRRWAKDHDKDVSETVRIALRGLIEDAEREKAAEAAVRHIRELAKSGIFEPPKGPWKAGGFR